MLLDDLHGRLAEAKRSPRCTFGEIYISLNNDERAALDLCIEKIDADRDIPQPKRIFTISWLTEVLNRNVAPIGKTTVSDHLRKKCICDNS